MSEQFTTQLPPSDEAQPVPILTPEAVDIIEEQRSSHYGVGETSSRPLG
jgi:hypothetical protein